MTKAPHLALFVAILLATPAWSTSLTVSVHDKSGKTLADAIVELVPDKPGAEGRAPAEAEIDQQHEMFVPMSRLIRKGGRIVFMNHDSTMHQVYSFSAIKQFQFEIRQGQRHPPIVFDTPGIAAVGCNIHDAMITYIYVAASPLAAETDAAGQARFDALPPGGYVLKVWHAGLPQGQPPQSRRITLGPNGGNEGFILPAQPMHSHMHMGAY